jgi:DNA-binding protein
MGVVYEGRMPNRAEILEMIKDRFGKKDLSTLEVRIGDKEYDSKKDKWVTAW